MTNSIKALIILFVFVSCGSRNDAPSGILNASKMQKVLWEVIQADTYTDIFVRKDSTANLNIRSVDIQNKIFSLNGISRETFYKSYDYYKKHPDMMKGVLDSISSKAERNRVIPYMEKKLK